MLLFFKTLVTVSINMVSIRHLVLVLHYLHVTLSFSSPLCFFCLFSLQCVNSFNESIWSVSGSPVCIHPLKSLILAADRTSRITGGLFQGLLPVLLDSQLRLILCVALCIFSLFFRVIFMSIMVMKQSIGAYFEPFLCSEAKGSKKHHLIMFRLHSCKIMFRMFRISAVNGSNKLRSQGVSSPGQGHSYMG